MGSDKMDKYLQKKPKYKEVETIDKVYVKAVDQADKEQGKKKKVVDKMLIRDETVEESEDGVGTMTYTAMHPHGGRGRRGYNKGGAGCERGCPVKCPHCGKEFEIED